MWEGVGRGVSRVAFLSFLCWDPCLHSVIATQVFLYMFLSPVLLSHKIFYQNMYKYGFLALSSVHINYIADLKAELKPGVKLTLLEKNACNVILFKWQNRADVIDHSIYHMSSWHEERNSWVQYLKVQQVIVEIWQGEAESLNVWKL